MAVPDDVPVTVAVADGVVVCDPDAVAVRDAVRLAEPVRDRVPLALTDGEKEPDDVAEPDMEPLVETERDTEELALADGEYDEVTDTVDDGVAVALLVWVEDGVDVGDVDDDPESVALSDRLPLALTERDPEVLALTDGEYDEVTDTDDDGVAVALLVWVEDGVDDGDVDDDPESVAV